MGKKELKTEKIDKKYEKLSDKGEPIEIFEQNVYFDKRQYSCKLPSMMIDYFKFQKGDKIRFIVDYSGKEPKLNAEYVRKK